jgi:hypothetical protein
MRVNILRPYAGVFQLYMDDRKKPLADRYIHCCKTTPDGDLLIVTGVPFLIGLLDDPGVNSFEDDTTFKRVEGDLNEWELAIYLKAVQRGTPFVLQPARVSQYFNSCHRRSSVRNPEHH